MILLILKTIGKVLLILFLIILVLLLCLLFVPFFYKIEANYIDNKPTLKCKISYMFPFLYVKGGYNEKVYLKLRIFGICLFDIEKKNKQKPEKKNKQKKARKEKKDIENSKEKAEAKGLETTKDNSKENTDTKDLNNNKETTQSSQSVSNASDDPSPQSENKKESVIHTIINKIKNAISFICQKSTDIINSIKNAQNKAEALKSKAISLYEQLTACDMQKAIAKGKTVLYKLFKKIFPRKWRLDLHFGTGDPGSTGQICGYIGMAYPFIGSHLDIKPDFEEKIYEGNLIMKGHISIISIVIAGLTFLFNKELKPLRDLIKNRT